MGRGTQKNGRIFALCVGRTSSTLCPPNVALSAMKCPEAGRGMPLNLEFLAKFCPPILSPNIGLFLAFWPKCQIFDPGSLLSMLCRRAFGVSRLENRYYFGPTELQTRRKSANWGDFFSHHHFRTLLSAAIEQKPKIDPAAAFEPCVCERSEYADLKARKN